MFHLQNETPYAVGLYPDWNQQGRAQQTLVVKASYHFDQHGQLTCVSPPIPIVLGDHYRGDPLSSSLKAADETVPFKQGGELYLTGTAIASSTTTTSMEVSIALPDRQWKKTLLVTGPRRWERKWLRKKITAPEVFQTLPLHYEYAYGGSGYRQNPAGKGLDVLPQIELAHHQRELLPAGFGPLSPTWHPRLAEYKRLKAFVQSSEDSPYGENPPSTLHHAAPRDQWFSQPFSGGERVILKGFFSTPEITLTLPESSCTLSIQRLHTAPSALNLACDTLTFDTDQQQISLLYRRGIECNMNEPDEGYLVLKI